MAEYYHLTASQKQGEGMELEEYPDSFEYAINRAKELFLKGYIAVNIIARKNVDIEIPLNNFDRIKGFSINELADFIAYITKTPVRNVEMFLESEIPPVYLADLKNGININKKKRGKQND